jgi:vancomycin resistance protein YoaR
MPPEDAEAALRLRYEDLQQHPLYLTYNDRVWRPSGAEIGLQVDWQAAVEQAMAYGREGSWLQRWRQRWRTWSDRYDLLLPAWLDENALRDYLMGVARTIDAPPLDAALAVEGQHVYIRAGEEGRSLVIGQCIEDIRLALSEMNRGPLALAVETISPDIDEEGAARALETARQMLAGPVVIRVEGDVWTLSPEQIGEMLTIELREDPGYETLVVLLDQQTLRDFVSEIAAEVQVHPRNAHFRFVDDQLKIVDEGAPGRELVVEVAMDRINEAVLSPDREVELNVLEVPPDIRRETIAEMGIKEIVGVGESNFGGSRPYRVHNILTAARILDGTLIAPGEAFSFIESIGAIDESDGFVQGYSIIGGRTVLNVGGGVCQVSTTVFRAAFFGALPIIERHAHAFRVGYYEQGSVLGMDATIYTGTGTDLKFLNDTGGYLLMQFEVYTTTGQLLVYLYGTNPGHEVVMDGPHLSNWTPAPTEPVYVYNASLPEGVVRQTDWAQSGVDATVYRYIKVDDEVVSTDTFFSHYQSWPNVFEVGTASQ